MLLPGIPGDTKLYIFLIKGAAPAAGYIMFVIYSNEQQMGRLVAHFPNSSMQPPIFTYFNVYGIFFCAESTQMEDPRLEWRTIQENMLREYLQTAQDALEVSFDHFCRCLFFTRRRAIILC